MKLVLIRHGKTEANEKRLYCGKTDIGLSCAGKEELIAKKQQTVYPDINGMAVVTSGKKRCEETLEIIYGKTPHAADTAFCEMDFGIFEMRSYEEMKNDPQYIAWISGNNEENIAPGGESGTVMRDRVLKGLRRVIASDRDALIVTHGGVIAAIMDFLFSEEKKNRYEWQPSFGGGYIVEYSENSKSYIPF
ncbi:MAG: histidine phosphatase family protein [Clostridia bacterium]|nr:histidine phosphatase family protein [Clostridia bacterium]